MIRSGAPRTGERSQTKWLWVGRPTLDIVGPVRNHTGYSLNTKRSVGEPAEGSLQERPGFGLVIHNPLLSDSVASGATLPSGGGSGWTLQTLA